MAEILMIHPREKRRVFGGMPPLGLGWVASYLEAKGYSVDFIDCQIDDRSFEDIIRSSAPRIIGITGTSHTRYSSFEIAQTAKRIDNKIFVVYGGSHATFTAEDTLNNVSGIDAIVIGEGEETLHEIVHSVMRGNSNLDGIRGVSFRKAGTVSHNPQRLRIGNIDSLPLPARHLMQINKYDLNMDFLNVPGTSIMSSRGCPINCSFCSASAMFGTSLSLRSAVHVVDEIEILLKEYGFKGIKFFDSTLTLKKDHILSICEEIIRRQLKFPWECEIRVNSVNKDILRTMKNAGCYYVDFGVESVRPNVLRAMHKGITMEQVDNVFEWTSDLGLLTKVFFTFGHIQETLDDAMATIDYIEQSKKQISFQAINVGIKIYPGTVVEKYAREIGCLKKGFSWVSPYFCKDSEFLRCDPSVPLLIQPQMGLSELKNKIQTPLEQVQKSAEHHSGN